MTHQDRLQLPHPFPRTRPTVTIIESGKEIDRIDCLELQWWFAIPRLGDHTMSAQYEADTLELACVTDMVATVPARIHGVDCVEIQVKESSTWKDWPSFEGFIYGRIEQDQTKWIAVMQQREGKKLCTFIDEGFGENWAPSGTRKLHDDGRYRPQADGSYRTTNGKGVGAGVYDVTIGENKFCCLRVLDGDPSISEGGELVEAYVELGGRTVFFRRYDGRYYRGTDLAQKYPNNATIVIDGVTYVHCDCTGRAHDTITNAGLGLKA
jgi:hypothetical protein